MFIDQAGALWLSDSVGLLVALGVCLAIGLLHVGFDSRRLTKPARRTTLTRPRRTTAPASLEGYRRARRRSAPLGPFAA